MPDVTCLGEFLIDMVSTQRNVPLFDAPAFEPKPGGAPANVAVGVARLGAQVAFIGKVGKDDFGRGLTQLLADEGIDTHNLLADSEALTTLAFVSLSDTGDPSFAFFAGAHTRLQPADLDLALIRASKILHFSSITLAHEPCRSATHEAIRVAKAAGVLVSYDVNFRPALYPDREVGRQLISAPLPLVDILKMNEGEIKLLTGESDVEAGLRKIDSNSPLVVVTMAEKGCLYRFDGKIHHAAVPPIEAVDATGAGDAFMAALLAGYRLPLSEDYLQNLMLRACKAGAITASKRGAIPSLPYAHQLD